VGAWERIYLVRPSIMLQNYPLVRIARTPRTPRNYSATHAPLSWEDRENGRQSISAIATDGRTDGHLARQATAISPRARQSVRRYHLGSRNTLVPSFSRWNRTTWYLRGLTVCSLHMTRYLAKFLRSYNSVENPFCRYCYVLKRLRIIVIPS